MKMKKVLSMLLVASMVASLICMPVLAEDTAAATTTYVEVENFSNYDELADLTAAGWRFYSSDSKATFGFADDKILTTTDDEDTDSTTYLVSPLYSKPNKMSFSVYTHEANLYFNLYFNGLYDSSTNSITSYDLKLTAAKTNVDSTNYVHLNLPGDSELTFTDGSKSFNTMRKYGLSSYYALEFEMNDNTLTINGNGVSTTIENVNYSDKANYSLIIEGDNSKNLKLKEYIAYEEPKTLIFTGGEGAEGEVAAVTAVAGSTVTLPANGFTKEGYDFAGWSDGTTTYQAGGSYVMPENGGTLTAVWVGAKEVSIAASNVRRYLVPGGTDTTNVLTLEEATTETVPLQRRTASATKNPAQAAVLRFNVADYVNEMSSTYDRAELSVYVKFTGERADKVLTLEAHEITDSWINDLENAEDLTVNFDLEPLDQYDETYPFTYAVKNTIKEYRLDVTEAVAKATADYPYVDLYISLNNNYGSKQADFYTNVSEDYAPKLVLMKNAADGFVNADGEVVDTLSNAITGGQVRITHTAGTANPIVALYDDEGMLVKVAGVGAENATSFDSANAWLRGTINLERVTIEEGYTLKMFVWYMDTIKPYVKDVIDLTVAQ